MTKAARLHWKKSHDVDAVCGRYGSTVTFTDIREKVTCGTCLRRMPAPPIDGDKSHVSSIEREPFDMSELLLLTDDTLVQYLVKTDGADKLLAAIKGRRRAPKPPKQKISRMERRAQGSRVRRRVNTKHRRHSALTVNYHHKLSGR